MVHAGNIHITDDDCTILGVYVMVKLRNKMAKIKEFIFLVIIFTLFSTVVLAQTPVKYCGDGICSEGETEANCEVDCRCVAEVIVIDETKEELIEREVPVPFFSRGKAVSLEETCGYDGNLDGYVCDPNEDWLNCPDDCSTPSLDSLLCLGQECLWQEAWFARTLVIVIIGIGAYLFYQSKNIKGKYRIVGKRRKK